MHDDDHGVKPLVIDISTTAASHTESTDHIASEARPIDDIGVEPDAAQSTELLSISASSAVLPLVLPIVDGSENFDEDDDGGEYDELCERHPDESVSSDSQSTVGSAGKDLTGSVSAGDLSPTPEMTARCSKSRRKADRVRTATVIFFICL